MKVGFVTRNVPPVRCGVGDYTVNLAHELSRRGVEVFVLSARQPTSVAGASGGIRLLPCLSGLGRALAPEVAKAIREERPDVLAFQYVPYLYGPYGLAWGVALLPLRVKRAGRTAVVSVLHELGVRWEGGPVGWGIAALQRLQLVPLVLGSNGIVVTDGGRADALRRAFPTRRDKVWEIPVGSNIARQPMTAQERQALRRDLSPDGAMLVGIFGTGHPDQNYEMAVEAVAALRPGVRLVCLGDVEGAGTRLLRLKALAEALGVEKYVLWMGYQDPETLSQYLSALDLFLHLHVEGPNGRQTTLVAALAHGLPVIAARGREQDRRFIDRQNVWLVPPGGSRALADAMQHLVEAPGTRADLGRRAEETYRVHFTWGRIADQFLAACGAVRGAVPRGSGRVQ